MGVTGGTIHTICGTLSELIFGYWHWGRFGSNFAAQGDGQRRTIFGLSLPGDSVVSTKLTKKVKFSIIGWRYFEAWGISLSY